MTANEAFAKAYSLLERRFPAKKLPIMAYYIDLVAEGDAQKADFLRLLTMEMAPDDLRPGGDYNTPRIEEAVRKLDLPSLEHTEDGSGDFMLGVLHARGILSFPHRELREADRQKALLHFKRASEKGFVSANAELAYYSQWAE